MKKQLGITILSTLLILGQPLMAFADTSVLASRVINFEELGSVIAEHNIDVQINNNSSLKDRVDFSDLKKTINDLEDELDSVDAQRDQAAGNLALVLPLNAGKRMLLDALKQAERVAVDRPTLEAMIDLKTTMSNDGIVLFAEAMYIKYNQLSLGISSMSSTIAALEKKLAALQLQEQLGIVTRNAVNNLKTTLVDLHTQLESMKFQQDYLERQFKILLNDPESTLTIGSMPSEAVSLVVENQAADLEKVQANNYAVKLQELQVKILKSALDNAKKDNGASSKQYKKANYDLMNANLVLTQKRETLKSTFYATIDSLTKVESELRYAQQSLEDKRVALSEAQLMLELGVKSQLEMNDVFKDFQVLENAVKAKEIDLFNAKCNYEWFLKGMPITAEKNI